MHDTETKADKLGMTCLARFSSQLMRSLTSISALNAAYERRGRIHALRAVCDGLPSYRRERESLRAAQVCALFEEVGEEAVELVSGLLA
eukprot:6188058-Pleurochrysis_carterae.AAC.2